MRLFKCSDGQLLNIDLIIKITVRKCSSKNMLKLNEQTPENVSVWSVSLSTRGGSYTSVDVSYEDYIRLVSILSTCGMVYE